MSSLLSAKDDANLMKSVAFTVNHDASAEAIVFLTLNTRCRFSHNALVCCLKKINSQNKLEEI